MLIFFLQAFHLIQGKRRNNLSLNIITDPVLKCQSLVEIMVWYWVLTLIFVFLRTSFGYLVFPADPSTNLLSKGEMSKTCLIVNNVVGQSAENVIAMVLS